MGMPVESTDARSKKFADKKKRIGKPFPKGIGGNPAGRPAAGMQSMKDRLAYWYETKSIGEIEKLIANKHLWNKLPAIDASLCRVISDGCQSSGLSALQFIWDRLLGKPAQAITGEDGKPLIPQVDLNEMARRTAFLLSLAQAQKEKPLLLDSSIPVSLDVVPA